MGRGARRPPRGVTVLLRGFNAEYGAFLHVGDHVQVAAGSNRQCRLLRYRSDALSEISLRYGAAEVRALKELCTLD